MTRMMRGPAIFLAQFAGDAAPFDTLRGIAGWAAALGYKGVQIPSWDARLFDLDRAADSDAYCDEVKSTLAQAGVELTELSTHLQGQLVAVHPAYDEAFDGFALSLGLQFFIGLSVNGFFLSGREVAFLELLLRSRLCVCGMPAIRHGIFSFARQTEFFFRFRFPILRCKSWHCSDLRFAAAVHNPSARARFLNGRRSNRIVWERADPGRTGADYSMNGMVTARVKPFSISKKPRRLRNPLPQRSEPFLRTMDAEASTTAICKNASA